MVQTALPPKQGIFFDGQIFDAYQFVSDLIRSAKNSIVLIDNYADDSILYTFGASFKDLGKKLFCFTLIESAEVVEVVRRLGVGEL
jgi:hypothetical protein